MTSGEQVADWIEQHADLSPLTPWQRQLVEQVFDPGTKHVTVSMPKRAGRTNLSRQVESARLTSRN